MGLPDYQAVVRSPGSGPGRPRCVRTLPPPRPRLDAVERLAVLAASRARFARPLEHPPGEA